MKRSYSSASDEIVSNGHISRLASLNASVSPPRKRFSDTGHGQALDQTHHASIESLSLADVEAGAVKVDDHVKLFATRLAQASRPEIPLGSQPRLSIEGWIDLYLRNQHVNGHHFVVHQHDHPVAGPHYDLRLQFSESSSLSWAIMYGLPGNPNSRRINRNATETRVHCVWNHLIETGSARTGSMIIWDTGEYEILPYYPAKNPEETDDAASDASEQSTQPAESPPSESEKLRTAFLNRKIRLRLHGTRLPKDYTISLRLSSENDIEARTRPTTKKRKRRKKSLNARIDRSQSTSRSSSPVDQATLSRKELSMSEGNIDDGQPASASDSDSVDVTTRLTNAYPGANNSVGSIHQRKWFVSLDRPNSGFVRDKIDKKWRRAETAQGLSGFEAFYVQGPDVERSVVTGRTGHEVLEDENASGFVPRRGWRAVLN